MSFLNRKGDCLTFTERPSVMNLSLFECGKGRTDQPNYIGDDHYQNAFGGGTLTFISSLSITAASKDILLLRAYIVFFSIIS